MMAKSINFQKGQSLIEVIVAMAVFAVISGAIMSVTLGSLNSLVQGGDETEARALAQEGIEAIRSVRDGAWNELIYSPAQVANDGSSWNLSGGVSELIDNKYIRTITISDVCRNGSDTITTCPASYTDPHTKLTIVNVSWSPRIGATNIVTQNSFLTNWDSRDWTQTNWSGGSGQSIWSDAIRYSSDDGNVDGGTMGEIKLRLLGSSGSTVWPFTTATDYSYNSSKIEVTGGVAELKGSITGGTIDSNTKGMWHLDEASGSITDYSGNNNNLTNAKGSPLYNQSGKFSTSLQFSGNSSRYINNGQQKGLGITGPMTIDVWIYKTSPATTNEAVVSKWRDQGNKRSYALIVNGNNKAEFWVSSNGSSAVNVTALNQVPLNQWVHIAGVYDGSKIFIFQNGILENSIPYNLGISNQSSFVSVSGADRFAGGNIFFNGKIDEARVSNIARWTSTFSPPSGPYGPPVYASDNPTIVPTTTFTAPKITEWSTFTETATKNGGQIYYQLSSDNGSTWKYWNGTAWATAGIANYNTASVINTNIGTFSTTTRQIMFKAFLSSDGSQQVMLDDVTINWTGNVSSYALSGNFISSAFNMNDVSPVQIVEWDEVKPANTNIQLQIRTAPDLGGAPGTWTNWYGASGVGSYFTTAKGSLVPIDLNGNQWVQYRVELSGDGSVTPTLQEMRVNYK